MFEFALLPLVVLVVAVIAWLLLSGRGERDPASSVDAFHRALNAMQPGGAERSSQGRGGPQDGTGSPDEGGDRDDAARPDDAAASDDAGR